MFKYTKMQANKVQLNKFRNEYIDYEVKQIRKDNELMQRAEKAGAEVLP